MIILGIDFRLQFAFLLSLQLLPNSDVPEDSTEAANQSRGQPAKKLR